ncbi:MAG: hypothetical protein SFX18_02250 [Pirellulales bacterium]|nr:hypothetical protein [Pirellulales bacterium]
MRIAEVFHLANGQTMLCGHITSGPGYICAGQYELSLDDKPWGPIELAGESMSGHVPGLRAVSTRQALALDDNALLGKELAFSVYEHAR